MINLIGQKFGRLIVIQKMDNDKQGHSRWLCRCNCKDKNETIVLGYHLKSGNTKSCGCLNIEKVKQRFTKHGHSKRENVTEIYSVWATMIQRCTNPNNKRWKDYGGRGITVCERWLNSFENFYEDKGKDWKPGFTLERSNNNKGYYKENCRWATRKEQMRNTRDNLYVPYNGKNRLLVELCEEHNMPYWVVWNRIYRYGWSPEEALTTPIRRRRKK